MFQNQEEKHGIIDNSGIRMYVTPTLREVEIGILSIGIRSNSMGMYVPPA